MGLHPPLSRFPPPRRNDTHPACIGAGATPLKARMEPAPHGEPGGLARNSSRTPTIVTPVTIRERISGPGVGRSEADFVDHLIHPSGNSTSTRGLGLLVPPETVGYEHDRLRDA